MSVKLSQFAALSNEKTLTSQKHILFVLSETELIAPVFNDLLQNKLQRCGADFQSLNKTPLNLDLPNGGTASFVVLKSVLTMFQKHTLLRKAVKPLLDENPEELAIFVFGDDATREAHACAAYYVATVNASQLPNHKG
ncbi:MAG: peptidase M17, partial [Methylotenera sp.]